MKKKYRLQFSTVSILKIWSIIIFILSVSSCNSDVIVEDIKSLDSQNNAISLRSMVAVSKCVDSYIYWNQDMVYSETHCWTEYYSTGSGGGSSENYYTGGEYDPGTSNPHGGSDYGSKDNPSIFKYTNISTIGKSVVGLNLKDKISLEGALNGFKTSCPAYNQLFDELTKSGVKLKFGFDNVTCEKMKAPAYYNTDSCGIYFRGPQDISYSSIVEELIHAVQHLCFYGQNMNNMHKDCEFEAKVFRDLATLILGSMDIVMVPTMSDPRPEFVSEYKSWITSVADMKFFPQTETVNFNDLSNKWKGYSGSSSSSFIPQLLIRYFHKANMESM